MIGAVVERIIAACDGASKGNPGRAAWAYVIADERGEPDRWEAGPLGVATNNVAELTALERLLSAVDPGRPVQIRMDSQYAMNAVTTWLPNWKRKGWKTAAGKPVANQELVVRIDALLTGRDVEFRYVPAHQVGGDRLNDFADRAASHAAVVQEPAGSDLGSPEPPASATSPKAGGGARKAAGTRRASGGSSSSGGAGRSGGGAGGASGGPARTLKAKYPGRCRCGRSYAAGELIARNDEGWGHPDCR
ncbi:ribonuclease H family protein [Actinacidiphila acididurans]|uniref:Ribonuclease H n=1 Tax=Actinacidiphila acididurans TaxID=2784346 RepID=A0ABS2U7H3_9ACTN|nr:ribonuclease H [Actinacidiphila acididurans]MBM9510113.1 ribonuclease HI [Actinacidiphila acididurans]